jgi:ribA/ribD-fused uncharacterized protein
MIIKEFQGEYRWLSNFWYFTIHPNDPLYKDERITTVEHLYQAEKAVHKFERQRILFAPTPGMAKKLARNIQIRDDWEDVKVGIMLKHLRTKFYLDPTMKQKLLATGDAVLEEGNRWHDTFWGIDLDKGIGNNILGKLIMKVRKEIRAGELSFEIDKGIFKID